MDAFDVCDRCGQKNYLNVENTRALLFLTEHRYNHFALTCPACGYTTVLMLEPDVFIKLVLQIKLPVRMYDEAPEQFKDYVRKNLDEKSEQPEQKQLVPPTPPMPAPPPALPPGDHVPTNDELPPIPRDWAIQFFDDLRNFGKEGMTE